MSKKLILFLMVLLFGSTSFLRADEVTIGDPTSTTTSTYLPAYSLYNYSLTQQIYTAEEIGMSGAISDVTMWLKNSSSYARNFNIYMKEVSESTFASTSAWVSLTDSDLVATYTLANGISTPVETTFALTTPFEYTGTGNLLICVQDVTGSWSSGAASVVMTATDQAIYAYRDASLYDPSNPGVTGYLSTNKSVVRLHIESAPTPPTPPTPTGELVITPTPFALGDRPVNGWMEPYAVKIYNGGAPVTVTASLSNTAGVNAFSMSQEINEVTLATEEELSFTININATAGAGEYTEEFTMFSVEAGRNITTVPVTSTFYTAGEADIVETAKTLTLSYTGGVANFSHTPANLHANYLLAGMTEMATDAVYSITLAKDANVTVNYNAAFYPYALGFQPTAAVEPAFTATANQEVTVLAGNYYMIVTGATIATVEGTVEQIPAPTALNALTPADGATNVNAPVTLTWEGGENATQYQVLFGTSPVNMPAVLDWTMIDDNYGSYTVTGLNANTQYFWQVKAKNSNGTVQTVRRGFTTTLTSPNNVTASEEEIFTDGSTLIKWKHSTGMMGDLPETQIGSGSSTSAYLPTYNLYNYSLTEQIYTGEEIGEAGYINSISFHPVGAITRNLKIYMANTDKTSFTSGSDWVAVTAENLVYEGNVAMVANTWVTVNLDEPFEFDGSNLLLVVTDHTGTWTSSIQYSTFDATAQAINVYQDSAPYNALAPAGSGTVRNFKNQIIINKDGAKNEPDRTFIGYNVYYGDVKANTELITEKQYLLENLPYNMTGHDINVTAVYDEGESGHSTPIVTVKVSGYATLTGTVTTLATTQAASVPVPGATVKFYGKDEFNNDVDFTTTTNANGVYTVTVKAGTYNRGVATLDGMEPANMEAPVTVAYQGTETVNFTIHEEYKPVLSVFAEEIDPSMSKVTWSLNTVITGGGTGGSGDEFSVNFDNSQIPAGWTMIDANNDGYNWVLGSAIGGIYLASGASLAGSGHNSSADLICSGSYSNATSSAITPDNYLVSPQVMIVPGSTFSFWACAQDASYAAEHYGVFVSSTGVGDWNLVQEWTMTAKSDGTMGIGRDGQTRAQGNWYQKTVDLSNYVGQMYIAIRHFNCNDQFILDVDDIELSAGSKGRSLDHYAVYRKAILKENEIVPADSVQLVDNYTDTLYADFTWNNMEPGLYQYGVSAVYPSAAKGGNRDEIAIGDGTVSSYQVPFNSLYGYSFTEQVYLASEIGTAGNINSISFQISNNYTSAQTNHYTVWMKNVARETFASNTDIEPVSTSDVVFEGEWEIPVCAQGDWITLTLDTPFAYDGTSNLLFAMHESTSGYSTRYFYCTAVTNSGISYYSDSYNPDPYNLGSYSGSKVLRSNRNNVILDITAGGAAGNDDPVTPITWSNILPKDMDATLTVEVVTPAGAVESARVELINQFEGEPDFLAVVDSAATSVVWDNFRKGNYLVTVSLDGYTSDYNETPVSLWDDENTITAHLTEILTPVEALSVSGTGYARWNAVVPQGRVAEKYLVTLDGSLYTETTDNCLQFDQDFLEVGENYVAGVAVVYSTGMSPYLYKTFTFNGCDEENPTLDTIYHEDMNVTLVWNGGTPLPPTPPTPPVGTVFNFDDGTFQGWTALDANNDGYNWVMGSQIGGVYLASGASLAGSGHNSSADLVCSGSYSNATSSAITPNNYLISPAKAEYTGISFWACAQDASYAAEHYGVAVSTGGATASEFTMIQEWTMTAKDQGVMSIGRDGQTRAQGNWYEKTVDLSAYAGQEIWVAIRHFNCNDQFILNVDDITLGVPEKCASAETCGFTTAATSSREQWDLLKDFNGTSGYQYGIATDGQFIYTSSWSASSTSMFYKYDMDGNFVEEFNVSGCGQIRDLTYDGQYFYGVANSSTIYCVDLANHALVGQTSSAYGAMRCCAYDSERDGFWVVGNWSGNLTLVDRTGAIQITGPAPTSASGVAYYEDADGVEHVLCFNNADNGVYDYNITTNTIGTVAVFNYNSAPGTGTGSSGGCHIANYGDKLAFYGDIQASPQYIAIYELGEAQGGNVSGTVTYTPNKFNILVDGEVVGVTADNTFTWECPDYDEHLYEVVWVDGDYNISCPEGVFYRILPLNVNTFDVAANVYPNPTNGDIRIEANNMVRISIVNTLGQVVYDKAVEGNEAIINMAQFGNGVYMVNIATENGTSIKRVVVSK